MYGTNQDNVRKCNYYFLNISITTMMFVIYLLKCYQANLCDEEWHYEIGAQFLFLINEIEAQLQNLDAKWENWKKYVVKYNFCFSHY